MHQEQQRYERARKRVQALKGFYIDAVTYDLVNVGWFVIDLMAGVGWWFFWP